MSALSDKIATLSTAVDTLVADVDALIAEIATLKTSSFTQADLDAVDAVTGKVTAEDAKAKAGL